MGDWSELVVVVVCSQCQHQHRWIGHQWGSVEKPAIVSPLNHRWLAPLVDLPTIVHDGLVPYVALGVVVRKVRVRDAEEDVVVNPFWQWANPIRMDDVAPCICKVAMCSPCWGKSKVVVDVGCKTVFFPEAYHQTGPLLVMSRDHVICPVLYTPTACPTDTVGLLSDPAISNRLSGQSIGSPSESIGHDWILLLVQPKSSESPLKPPKSKKWLDWPEFCVCWISTRLPLDIWWTEAETSNIC